MEVSENDKAAMYLESELQNIRESFERGEMRAFGTKQEVIIKAFQEIRQSQAQLAMKQVSMLGEMMKNDDFDKKEDFMESAEMKEKEASLRVLTESLQGICKLVYSQSIHSKLTTT